MKLLLSPYRPIGSKTWCFDKKKAAFKLTKIQLFSFKKEKCSSVWSYDKNTVLSDKNVPLKTEWCTWLDFKLVHRRKEECVFIWNSKLKWVFRLAFHMEVFFLYCAPLHFLPALHNVAQIFLKFLFAVVVVFWISCHTVWFCLVFSLFLSKKKEP